MEQLFLVEFAFKEDVLLEKMLEILLTFQKIGSLFPDLSTEKNHDEDCFFFLQTDLYQTWPSPFLGAENDRVSSPLNFTFLRGELLVLGSVYRSNI